MNDKRKIYDYWGRIPRQFLLKMKLTICVFFLSMMAVTANVRAQRISLNVKAASLENVLLEITKQSRYTFIYSEKDMQLTQAVTLKLSNQELVEALDEVLSSQPLTFEIKGKTIILSSKKNNVPQPLVSTMELERDQQPIRGRVTNEKGEPLIGASIYVLDASGKRSGVQTKTDAAGAFEFLNAAIGSKLEVTFLGYKTVSLTASNNHIHVSLEPFTADVAEVEVMVNTGYQILKPNEVNGAVTVIDNYKLNLQNGTNILQRLDGVTNGLTFQTGRTNLNPQNKLGITVRGYGTINGPLDPLIVLDEFVYEGDIDNINPNDIESVTVLKDAEATSIYGARGGNGVIVLTSKKSKGDGKTSVNLNYNSTWKEKPNLSKLLSIKNEDYIGLEEMLFESGRYDGQLTAWNSPPVSPLVYWMNEKRKNSISEETYSSYREFYAKSNFKDQYAQHFYNIANTQQVSLQLSGGNKKHSYILSVSQDAQKDNYTQPNYRTNVRLANTARVFNWLAFNVSASYSSAKSESFNIPSYETLSAVGEQRSVPYLSLLGMEGESAPFYRFYGKSILDTIGKGRLLDWNYYPMEERDHNSIRNATQEFIGNIGLEFKLFPGGELKLSYQRNRQDGSIEDHFGQHSYYVRDRVNAFSKINETTGEVTYILPKGDIVSKSIGSLETYAWRSQFNFQRKINAHTIMTMLGFEMREKKSWGSNTMFFGYREDPLSYASVDRTTLFVTKPFGSSNSIGGDPSITPIIVNRFVSFYGNFYYTWKERYSLSGNIRRDGSNLFGVSANDKWKPLWAIGMGYEISKESFFQYTPFSYLKFKTTLGYSGNVDLSKGALPVTASLRNTVLNGGLPYGRISTINNPLLRWEEVMQLNVGIEWRLKQLPLSGSIEYYVKNGNDLYGISSYDYTSWGATGTISQNVAAMKGHGLDLQINYIAKWNKLAWHSTATVNLNKNRTTKSYYPYNETELSRLVSSSGTQINPVVGYPLYGLAAFVWKGLDNQGNPQGVLNGEISTDYIAISNSQIDNEGAIRFVGSAIPTHFGGWLNTFHYNQFSASFNLTYRMGYYFRRNSFTSSALSSYTVVHPDYYKRWEKEGDRTDVPALEYPLTMQGRDGFYTSSEVLVEKADHVRLQFVNLTYNFKLSKWKITNIETFINVNNIGILWRANKNKLDPDMPESIPLQKNYTLGFRISI